MKYMSFDPGNHTGWATFGPTGELLDMGMVVVRKVAKSNEFSITELERLLDDNNPDIVICESFNLRQEKALQQSGSDMLTSQVEGAIRAWTSRKGRQFHRQPASLKPIAYKWAGRSVPKNKDLTHEMDAYVHGIYWLIKNNVRSMSHG